MPYRNVIKFLKIAPQQDLIDQNLKTILQTQSVKNIEGIQMGKNLDEQLEDIKKKNDFTNIKEAHKHSF